MSIILCVITYIYICIYCVIYSIQNLFKSCLKLGLRGFPRQAPPAPYRKKLPPAPWPSMDHGDFMGSSWGFRPVKACLKP